MRDDRFSFGLGDSKECMLAKSHPLRAILRCGCRSRLVIPFSSAYTFHATASLAAAATTSSDAPKPFTKTRKSFEELPKTRILPDGSEAPPLEEWLGGLEALDSPIKPFEDPIAAVPSNSEMGHFNDDASKVTTKKRVRRAKVVEKDVQSVLETAPDQDASEAPKGSKKSRRRTSDLQDDRGQLTSPTKNEGRVAAALPARRRNKRRTTEDPASEQPRNQLAKEILDNLSRFSHCLLLTRVGQFYESYFQQAEEISRLLNIKLTSRSWDGHRILMCGFPLAHVNKYLKILVQQNRRFVAMCEEFPRPAVSDTKAGFDRRVVRVITPGTLIDEPFLNQYENNYLLAIGLVEDPHLAGSVGLAWIDVSTGEFFVKTATVETIRDELARIAPKEIVLDESLQSSVSHPLRQALNEEGCFVSYIVPKETDLPDTQISDTTDDITSRAALTQPSPFTLLEDSAVRLLTTFMHANLLEHMPRLYLPNREVTDGRMQIDAHTINALEIREGMREGGLVGSLLSVIKRTVTSSGTRLLARWLCSPSTSMAEINARQSLVAFFHARPHLREDLSKTLAGTEDVTRIVQKFLLGRGEPGDLYAVTATISIWMSIQKRVENEKTFEERERKVIDPEQWSSIDVLMSRMSNLHGLFEKITNALRNRPSMQESSPDGLPTEHNVEDDLPSTNWSRESYGKWFMNPEFSKELSDLHRKLSRLLADRERLQDEVQRVFDAPSVTLRSSPGYGMHVHLAKAKRDKEKMESSGLFSRIAASGSTICYFHQPWSSLGNQIFDTITALTAAEKQAFEKLRSEINALSGPLRRNARILDELDVTLSFATLATEMNLVRPVIRDDTSYEVRNGRHPTVELGLLKASRVFVPNSISFTPESRLHVITGPNMAGKSTALRQTALIAILAQIGSFVPADSATVGLVDKLFSRVGAKDDLFRDRSTFMVEMLETTEILRRATPKSLVIMDEVGRGTTVRDGLAIAFATIHHLITVNGCRALFATHFHELADMLGYAEDNRGREVFRKVSFYCTDVDETSEGHFAYAFRLKPGVNRDSHGLKVAQLAGMPPQALAVASDALRFLKDRHDRESIRSPDLWVLGQAMGEALRPPS